MFFKRKEKVENITSSDENNVLDVDYDDVRIALLECDLSFTKLHPFEIDQGYIGRSFIIKIDDIVVAKEDIHFDSRLLISEEVKSAKPYLELSLRKVVELHKEFTEKKVSKNLNLVLEELKDFLGI